MVQSEKELEDYMCDNDNWVEVEAGLQNVFGGHNDYIFLGRQIKLGQDNIADLVYFYETKTEKEVYKTYIIVELKFRELVAKDFSQIARYITILESKLRKDNPDNNDRVVGLFVSKGMTPEVQNISLLYNNRINFLKIKSNIVFNVEEYSYDNEYIEKLVLDERIKNGQPFFEKKNPETKIKEFEV